MFRFGLRSILGLIKTPVLKIIPETPKMIISKSIHNFIPKDLNFSSLTHNQNRFLVPDKIVSDVQTRNLTKFSLRSGKRKAVKAVMKRFYRLEWGAWIRTKCGRHKKLFRKSAARKRRLRQHVFTNATQSYLLDKMVTRYWRKPKYYPDDPYNPYHKREEFPYTRKSPLPPTEN